MAAEPPRFAHPVERELAALLDRNGIAWEYEPHCFPLELDGRGQVLQAVSPDFYLPEIDLYIECTVMREPTRKRRKLRKVQELHGIVVAALERRDLARLAKHGFLLPRPPGETS
jgi:hypoxanthine phosphoribosyltransferase